MESFFQFDTILDCIFQMKHVFCGRDTNRCECLWYLLEDNRRGTVGMLMVPVWSWPPFWKFVLDFECSIFWWIALLMDTGPNILEFGTIRWEWKACDWAVTYFSLLLSFYQFLNIVASFREMISNPDKLNTMRKNSLRLMGGGDYLGTAAVVGELL